MKQQNSLWEPRAINTIRYEVWPLSSGHLKLEEAAISYEDLYHANSIKRRSKTNRNVFLEYLLFFSCNPWKTTVFLWLGAAFIPGRPLFVILLPYAAFDRERSLIE